MRLRLVFQGCNQSTARPCSGGWAEVGEGAAVAGGLRACRRPRAWKINPDREVPSHSRLGSKLQSARFDAARHRSALPQAEAGCSARRTWCPTVTPGVDPRPWASTTFAVFRATTRELRRASMRRRHRPAVVPISSPRAAQMFLSLVAKEACGMHVRLHLCGGGSGAASASAKAARKGRVTRLTPFPSRALGREHRGHQPAPRGCASQRQVASDRGSTKPGQDQRSPLAAPSEAGPETFAHLSGRSSWLHHRELAVSLTISTALSPTAGSPTAMKDICSRWGRGRPRTPSINTSRN